MTMMKINIVYHGLFPRHRYSGDDGIHHPRSTYVFTGEVFDDILSITEKPLLLAPLMSPDPEIWVLDPLNSQHFYTV